MRRLPMSLIVAFALITSCVAIAVSLPKNVTAFVSHAPIEILNDENFTAANGVTSGNGTYGNPYVISGLEIDLATQTVTVGISIQNAYSYFLIRNVYIHSGNLNPMSYSHVALSGISLYNVWHGQIENSRFSNNSFGIQITSSRGITITGCEITDNSDGIFSEFLQGSTIANNLISRNDNMGIELFDALSCSVIDNTITGSGTHGIDCYNSVDCTINGNSISENVNGLNVGYSHRTTVKNNTISDNDNFGMMVYGSTETKIEGNTFSNNKVEIEGQDNGGLRSLVVVLAIAAISIVAIIVFLIRPKKGSPEVSSVPMPPNA